MGPQKGFGTSHRGETPLERRAWERNGMGISHVARRGALPIRA